MENKQIYNYIRFICRDDCQHSIRDHNQQFRSWLRQYEPDPVDENAEQALMDPEYAVGMDTYDKAYQSLSEEIWKTIISSQCNLEMARSCPFHKLMNK